MTSRSSPGRNTSKYLIRRSAEMSAARPASDIRGESLTASRAPSKERLCVCLVVAADVVSYRVDCAMNPLVHLSGASSKHNVEKANHPVHPSAHQCKPRGRVAERALRAVRGLPVGVACYLSMISSTVWRTPHAPWASRRRRTSSLTSLASRSRSTSTSRSATVPNVGRPADFSRATANRAIVREHREARRSRGGERGGPCFRGRGRLSSH